MKKYLAIAALVGAFSFGSGVERRFLVEARPVSLGPDFRPLPRKSKGEKKRAAAAMRRKGWK